MKKDTHVYDQVTEKIYGPFSKSYADIIVSGNVDRLVLAKEQEPEPGVKEPEEIKEVPVKIEAVPKKRRTRRTKEQILAAKNK